MARAGEDESPPPPPPQQSQSPPQLAPPPPPRPPPSQSPSPPPQPPQLPPTLQPAPPPQPVQPTAATASLDGGASPKIHGFPRLQGTASAETYTEVLYKIRENIGLIATLIASFTYSAGINPPGGVHQEGNLMGTAIAAKRTAFRVFFVFNNMALFTSLSVVLFLLSIDLLSYKRKIRDGLMKGAHVAMWAAVFFMAAAYAAASVVVMRPPPGVDWPTVFVFAMSGGLLAIVFALVVISYLKEETHNSQTR